MFHFYRTILIVFTLSMAPFTSATENNDAAAAFTKMKSLVGLWQREGRSNSTFGISFELTANGSTLLETWLNKGKKHSLTVYHMDGDSLMATHYCPQGNQPRLKLTKASSHNKLDFQYFDASNLQSLDQSHQHSLGFDLSDMAHKITRSETYQSKSGEDPSEMVLVRASGSAHQATEHSTEQQSH